MIDNIDEKELIFILKDYLNPEVYKLHNFHRIISKAKKSTNDDGEEIVEFDFNDFKLYLYYKDYSYYDSHP